MIKARIALFSLITAVVVFGLDAGAVSDKALYEKAQNYLKEGEEVLAFLAFRQIIHMHSDSPYMEESMYHIIKYYMGTKNFFEAARLLKKHLVMFPESKYRQELMIYVGRIRVKESLKKGARAFNRFNYELAVFYYEEALKIDPENAEAKRQLEEIDRILIHSNYRRSQLEKEKQRIESESREIAKAMAAVDKQRKLAAMLKQEAQQMDQQTREEYQKLLSEAESERNDLKQRVNKLMTDLEEWKQRAKKYEAKMLAEPDITGLKLASESRDLPRIIFEGGASQKGLNEGEQQPKHLLQPKSPSVVLVAEKIDDHNNVLQSEFVVSVDLRRKWPSDCQLKLRVDFFNLLSDNQPTRIARPKIIYYSQSDMDEVDEKNLTYRKKVAIGVDKKKFQKYEVAAYFVRQKSE